MNNVQPQDRRSLYHEGPPPVIPDHEVIKCIGRGSYGDVWLARNVISQYRAVKIIYRDQLSDDRPFEREFEGIKRFEPISRSHPGLVQVLQVGRNDTGRHFYYVMELGDDAHAPSSEKDYTPQTLSRVMAGGRLPFEQVIEIGIALADALCHLHVHGLVHRDVKPSNIIFVGGKPKLADIGLIALVTEETSMLGTAGYIAPEGRVSAQSDVFSLGKVLWELSTGSDRTTYPKVPDEVIAADDHKDFAELQAVIDKACASSPAARYKSAADLRADLEMLRAGKSVLRLRLLEKRISLLTQAAVVAAVLFVAAAVILFFVNKARQREKELRAAAYVTSAARFMEQDNFHAAVPLLSEALRLASDDPALAKAERVRLGMLLQQSPRLLAIWTNATVRTHVSFLPGRNGIVVVQGKVAQFLDLETRAPLLPNRHFSNRVDCLAVSPDGRHLLAGEGKRVDLVDVESAAEIHRWRRRGTITAVAFSADNTRVAIAEKYAGEPIVSVFDVMAPTNPPLLELRGHRDDIESVEFEPAGKFLVTASRDGTVRVWDGTTGSSIGPVLNHSSWVYSARVSPDGRSIATACGDRTIRVWDAATHALVTRWPAHKDAVTCLAWSPDARLILSGGVDQTACVWRRDGNLAAAILNHENAVTSVAFDASGRRVASAGFGGTVKVWDIAALAPEDLGNAVFTHDGSRVAIATNRAVAIYEMPAFKPAGPPIQVDREFQLRLFSDDGRAVCVSSQTNGDTFIAVLGQNISAPVWLAAGQADVDLTLSRDGGHVFTVEEAGRDRWRWSVWNSRNGNRVLGPIVSRGRIPPNGAFSAGNHFASSAERDVQVWDLATQRKAGEPLRQPHSVSALQFLADGRRLLAADSDQNWTACAARIWEIQTQKMVAGPFSHHDGVLNAALSPDEKFVVTCSEDKSAATWRVLSGEMAGPAIGHRQHVVAAAFNHDARWIVTASLDGVMKVSETTTGFAVTAPFQLPGAILSCGFVAGDAGVWVRQRSGTSLWRFALVTNSYEELKLLAGALGTARVLQGSDGWSEADARRWRSAQEKVARPQLSPGMESWHHAQALVSERLDDWFAARFHWQQLTKLAPGDAQFIERFREADRRWRAPAENNTVTTAQ